MVQYHTVKVRRLKKPTIIWFSKNPQLYGSVSYRKSKVTEKKIIIWFNIIQEK